MGFVLGASDIDGLPLGRLLEGIVEGSPEGWLLGSKLGALDDVG